MNQGGLNGIVPPLVTPLRGIDKLDIEGLNGLIEHVVSHGVNGLFVLGTTGEAPSLSYDVRRQMIRHSILANGGRVPVLVGITDTSFVESVNLARYAADVGADALVLTTPYYFPAGQTELKSYIRNLIPQLPLPVVLYNMPALTKVRFEIETIRELSDMSEIHGVKDSSGDLEYFRQLVELKELRPDWTIMIGPEHLLGTAVQLGGNGGIAGGANVWPKLFVDYYQAAVAGSSDEVTRLSGVVEDFQEIYRIGKYASRHIKATKCALSLMGICDDCLAEPFHRFHAPERKRVENILQSLGLV